MRLGVVQWHLMKLEEAISSFNAAEAHLSLTHGMNHPTGKGNLSHDWVPWFQIVCLFVGLVPWRPIVCPFVGLALRLLMVFLSVGWLLWWLTTMCLSKGLDL